jgi:hypothetical protein
VTREILLPRDVNEDHQSRIEVPQWAKEYAANLYAPQQPARPIQRAEYLYQPPSMYTEDVYWGPQGSYAQRSQSSPYYQGGYGWSDYRRNDAWGQPYQPQMRYQQPGRGGYDDPYNYQYQRPNYDNRQPSYDYRQPSYDYRQPNYDYRQPNYDYRQPNYDYRQPNYDYRQPNYDYRQPNNGYNYGRPQWGYQPGDGYPQPGQPYRQPYYGNVPYDGSNQRGYDRGRNSYRQPDYYPAPVDTWGYGDPYFTDAPRGGRGRNQGRYQPRYEDQRYYNNDQYYDRNQAYGQWGRGGNATDFNRLNYTISGMVGHSIREYHRGVPESLGCAAFVSAALRQTYGMRISDTNCVGLERTLQRQGFVAVPINQAQPGDVVIGHRGGGRAGHAAIYMGGDRIANNSSGQRRIVVDGIGKFFKGDFRSVTAYRKVV